jgi:GxxExxY protein
MDQGKRQRRNHEWTRINTNTDEERSLVGQWWVKRSSGSKKGCLFLLIPVLRRLSSCCSTKDAEMNTDEGEKKLLFREEVYQIVGAAMEVLNELGHGLHEKPYENALVVEFGLRQIGFKQQRSFDILYKGHVVGLFIPDIIACDTVVVDTKVVDRITDVERGQMLNYLKIVRLRVGVILNFKHPKLEWERIVL